MIFKTWIWTVLLVCVYYSVQNTTWVTLRINFKPLPLPIILLPRAPARVKCLKLNHYQNFSNAMPVTPLKVGRKWLPNSERQTRNPFWKSYTNHQLFLVRLQDRWYRISWELVGPSGIINQTKRSQKMIGTAACVRLLLFPPLMNSGWTGPIFRCSGT